MPFSEESLKRQRVSRACDNCRRKKVRCDGLHPNCSNCSALDLDCTYLDTSKKRGPPKGYIEAIENRLHRMEHLLSDLVQSDPRAAESVLAELQKLGGLDDVRLRLANRARPSEFNELRKRDQLNLLRSSPVSLELSSQDKTWDSVMEALSDEANQLTLEDQGRVRYMGFSSGFYLLQNTEKYQDGLFRMKPLTQCPPDNEDIYSNPFVLPSAPVFEHLMDVYFNHINPIIPLLHKANFMTKLKRNMEAAPLFLLNAIFALASNLSSKIQWLDQENARSEVFYKRAKKLLDQTYDVTSLENVQALILLSHYFHITHGSMKSWVYSGMAIRLAEDLGLHRNPDRWQIKTLSYSLKETRKRAWWSCYVMDRNASACMGRPLCIDDRHCDTAFPQLNETNVTSPVDESLDSGICMTAFVEIIKLHEIFGRIMNNIYAIRAHPNQNPFKSESFLLELDSALHKWLVELPTDLQYSPKEYFGGRKPASNYVVYLHVLYHSALILLHRPYIPNPNSRICPSPYPSLQICITSANSITTITDMCSGEPGLEEVLIFVLFPIFTAATVYVTNMSAKDTQLADLAKKNLTKNMSLLSKIRKRWGSAGKYYIVLRELLAAQNGSINEHSPTCEASMSSASYENKKATISSQPLSLQQDTGVLIAAHHIPPIHNPNLPPSSTPQSIPVSASGVTVDHLSTTTAYPSNGNLEGSTYSISKFCSLDMHKVSSKDTIVPAHSSNFTHLGSCAIVESITNVGFDPSAPSNTLSEMSVNNQQLVSQYNNFNSAPLWNVPLSFNIDEWNEYVGQYSRNLNSSAPACKRNQEIPHIPATSPSQSILYPIVQTGVQGDSTQLNQQFTRQPEVSTKDQSLLKARPLHLYNSTS